MNEITLDVQLAKIKNYERGFRATNVINVGLRYGLFAALNERFEGRTPAETAWRLNLHEPYLRVWCQTAYHFELLDCDELGRFRLQPCLDQVLSIQPLFDDQLPNSGPMAGGPELELDAFIRTGRVPVRGKTLEASMATAEATRSVYLVFFSIIFAQQQWLPERLNQGVNWLDVGCGTGNLMLELAHAFPESRFSGLDPDVFAVRMAENAIMNLGFEDRVTVQNIGGDEIGSENEYDIVSLAATLHEIQPEVRVQTLINIRRALKPGGKLIILDFPYPARIEDFRNPRYNFGIIEQYFEVSSGIVHLSGPEQDELLLQAGFKNIERRDIANGTFDLIMSD